MNTNLKSSKLPKMGSFNLSRYYNASQLRIDTWSRLRAVTSQLNERQKITVGISQTISECFEILEPIETYRAFPGKDVLEYLKELFEREEHRLLSNWVAHVVQTLMSSLYRQRVTPIQLAGLDDMGVETDLVPEIDQNTLYSSHRHYFEVLFVDNLPPAEARRLRHRMLDIARSDERYVYDIVVVPSFEDALIAVMLNHNIQSCVIRTGFSLKSKNRLEVLQSYISGVEDLLLNGNADTDIDSTLGQIIKRLRPELDLYLVLDSGVEATVTRVHQTFRRVFYSREDYFDLHLSIRRGILERHETPFFKALKEYSQRPTGVFHAMPLSRGNSIFKSHWIEDMGEFYGRNIFLAETSATTGGLDSLLQPTGPLKKAQALAARAFGAQHTFFVTNGTSTANKIVTQALIQPGDIVLIDRDCHKSHHYGLMLSGAYPVYLDSYPVAEYSMYGAVPLREIKKKLLAFKQAGRLEQVKMLLLTNCTFDGLVYNVERVMEEVLAIKPDMIFLWDEAWFGFAAFTPTYRQRTAMATSARLCERYQSDEYRERYNEFRKHFEKQNLDDEGTWLDTPLLPDPDVVKVRAYATQSTHKKLTAFRQASMIHIYDEEFNRRVEETFHEAYMTHTSTSPNYQILASLDIGRRQVELEGFKLVQRSIEMAMTIRAKIAEHPMLQRYFRVITIQDLIPEGFRPSGIAQYYEPETGWTRMEAAWRGDEFVLDPTHITLYTGMAGIDGDTFKNRYLMDQFGIQVNKTSRNTVLFMTNIGTTRSSVAFLIGVLTKIAQQLEAEERAFNPAEKQIHRGRVRSLTEELPPLPDFSEFHPVFRTNPMTHEGDIRAAYFMAYNEEKCEFLRLDGTIQKVLKAGRSVVSTSFVIPYPPGFPVLVPGQVVSQEILDFLKALDVKEIHGYRPDLGMRVFTEEALNEQMDKWTNGLMGKPIDEPVEEPSISGKGKGGDKKKAKKSSEDANENEQMSK